MKIAPPSPNPPKFLVGKNDVVPISPIVPANLSPTLHPKDCALSSITFKLCFLAIAMIDSISVAKPKRWVAIITLDLFVIFVSRFDMSILNVSRSTSINTGIRPKSTAASAAET